MSCNVCPNAHTLTLKFHRFLSEVEWRAVVEHVRTAPFLVELEANAVQETPEELARERLPENLPSVPSTSQDSIHDGGPEGVRGGA